MLTRIIYKIWSKISRATRRIARNYTLFILRFVVLPLIALAGSKIIWKKPAGNSLWSEWNEKPGQELVKKQTEKNWVIGYFFWTFQRENQWAIFLFPFILMLKATEEPGEAPTLESSLTYTLF